MYRCVHVCVHVQRRRHLDGDRRWRGRDGPDLAFGVDAGKDAVDMWDMWDMWGMCDMWAMCVRGAEKAQTHS